MLNAQDFRNSIAAVVRYAALVTTNWHVRVREIDNELELNWTWPRSLRRRAQLSDFTAAAISNRIRAAINRPHWMPNAVALDRSPPADLRPYARLLGDDISFDAHHNAIRLDHWLLGTRLPKADANLFGVIRKYSELLLDRPVHAEGPTHDIKLAILDNLAHGESGIDAVARRMGLTTAQVRNRLRKAESTYRDVRDGARKEAASKYLRDPRLSVSEIASILGYSEISALTRAARRWFGRSPRQYRENPDTTE
jgi:AraC-like DNA-binding protein